MKTTFEELTADDIVNEFPKYQHLVNDQLTAEDTKNLSEQLFNKFSEELNDVQRQNILDYTLSLDVGPLMYAWNQGTSLYSPIIAKGILDREEVIKILGDNYVKNMRFFAKGMATKLTEIVKSPKDSETQKKFQQYIERK